MWGEWGYEASVGEVVEDYAEAADVVAEGEAGEGEGGGAFFDEVLDAGFHGRSPWVDVW